MRQETRDKRQETRDKGEAGQPAINFENMEVHPDEGIGVMSTSDTMGVVNSADCSRPHIREDNSLAFIMRDHLIHKNLMEN